MRGAVERFFQEAVAESVLRQFGEANLALPRQGWPETTI